MSVSGGWRDDNECPSVSVSSLIFTSCYRGGESPSRDCPKCNEEICPKHADECPQGLVPDVCGCCPQGLCGLADGEKCFNVSLSKVLPPESRKFGVCGANLHCLLRPDLKFRVSDVHGAVFVSPSVSLSVCLSLNHLSAFYDIRYRSLYKDVVQRGSVL